MVCNASGVSSTFTRSIFTSPLVDLATLSRTALASSQGLHHVVWKCRRIEAYRGISKRLKCVLDGGEVKRRQHAAHEATMGDREIHEVPVHFGRVRRHYEGEILVADFRAVMEARDQRYWREFLFRDGAEPRPFVASGQRLSLVSIQRVRGRGSAFTPSLPVVSTSMTLQKNRWPIQYRFLRREEFWPKPAFAPRVPIPE